MASYSSESFYNGGDSSLEPSFGDYSASAGHFTGFNKLSGSQIGVSGNPTTANQLGEVLSAIRQGTKNFEIGLLGVQGDPDQIIPKQHFEEIRALAKLTGVKPSVHGPLMDAAGFTDRGWGGEETRKQNERRMFDAIEKAHVVGPKENIIVNFHTGNAGGYSTSIIPGKDGKPTVERKMIINKDTKQINQADLKYKFTPIEPKSLEGDGKLWTPEKQIDSINETEWENSLMELAQQNKHANEILGSAKHVMGQYKNSAVIEGAGGIGVIDLETGKKLSKMNDAEMGQFRNMRQASFFLDNVQMSFHSAFEKAFKYGTPEQKKKLRELSKEYRGHIEKIPHTTKTTSGEIIRPVWEPMLKEEILVGAFEKLEDITKGEAPKIYEDASKFAMEKAADTFGTLTSKSYKKFGETSPTIVIENVQEGMGFSTAEDHAKLIEQSRAKFEKYLMEDQKKSKKEAEKIAEKLIGATWDVGHSNVAKGKGFDDKYVIGQAETIAPYVKHVHLTDNFGFNDSHLVPGMGNVPIKGILEKLEKAGKIDEMKMIVEAGGFGMQFKKPTQGLALSAFGTGIHSAGGYENWTQAADLSGHYFGGFGTINPEIHHSIYGSGFTTMPMDLGGQMPGAQSRFSGNPMS